MKRRNFISTGTISKGSRFGVGSLIRYQAFDGLKTVSGDLRHLFYWIMFSPILQFFVKAITLENSFLHTSQDQALSFQRGEERGFEWFFRLFYPALSLFAFKITRNKQAAEELASQAFIKIWEKHRQFNHPAAIRSYLYQVVKNDALKWLERERKEDTALVDLTYLHRSETESHHLQFMMEAELTRHLAAALEFLPPQCSKILRMLYVEGKSVKETALALNLSVSTVRTQQKRGINNIRERLGLASFLLSFLAQ